MPRHGSCLEHGQAHRADHRRWSRRDFLTSLGLVAGGSVLLGKTPVRAFARSPLLQRLQGIESDRVLVLIQLFGGNDGLNTIIPIGDPTYYLGRPTLRIEQSQAHLLAPELYVHPSFEPLHGLYNDDGHMAIIQNVGYPSPDLSHFRGTDIWLTASDADDYLTSGWTGRSLEAAYPQVEDDPLPYPLAVQIGGISSVLFQGADRNMGMTLTSPELFERLASEGRLYDTDNVPATAYGTEMAYLRGVASDAFRYATAIQEAAAAGANEVEYPGDNYLAWNLSIVARLIKGGLGARIYHVSIDGFDTHAAQAFVHATLLRRLAEAVVAFQQDLARGGWDDRVLAMTFSEFGRRVEENGSQGTDHGTGAPMFLFGTGVNGGRFGNAPVLDDLDDAGNLRFDVDFRAVYSTILQHWFGFSTPAAVGTLGRAYEPLPVIGAPAPTATEAPEVPRRMALDQNYPNPFNRSTTITYALDRPARAHLRVYDMRGRLVRTLVDGPQPAGTHTVTFDVGTLPSGPYLYRLVGPDGTFTRKMLLVR